MAFLVPVLAAFGGGSATMGAVSLGGMALSVMGGLSESEAKSSAAKGQAAISEYNARVAEQQAKAEKLRSGYEQVQQAKEAERIKSAMRAAAGEAGGVGSPVLIDVELEQARELELENLLIGYEGEVASQRLRSQAVADRLQAKIYKQQAKSAKKAGLLSAGSSILSFATPFLSGLGGGS